MGNEIKWRDGEWGARRRSGNKLVADRVGIRIEVAYRKIRGGWGRERKNIKRGSRYMGVSRGREEGGMRFLSFSSFFKRGKEGGGRRAFDRQARKKGCFKLLTN